MYVPEWFVCCASDPKPMKQGSQLTRNCYDRSFLSVLQAILDAIGVKTAVTLSAYLRRQDRRCLGPNSGATENESSHSDSAVLSRTARIPS
jgi:hypothetical protein